MSTAGRPPKPTEQKRRLGNPGGRPLPTPVTYLPAAQSIPEPPRPLGAHGRVLWDRLWNMGRSWISESSDLELVLLVCEQTDERHALRIKLFNEGSWRDRGGLRALEKQITSNLGELGCTPSERARLGVAEVTTSTKIEQLRRARDDARNNNTG